MTHPDDPGIWEKEVLELSSGTLPRRAIALLTGFEVTHPITIGPITIRGTDDPLDKALDTYRLSGVKCAVLELKYLERERGSSISAEPWVVLERSFFAVQVAVDSWVGMSQIHHLTDAGDEVGIFRSLRYRVADSWHPTQEPTISRDDAFPERFLLAIRAQPGNLDAPLRRFSRACCEIMEESVIDFAIVLDGLLGRGISDEIAHRVATRGALLIATNPEERIHYYRSLKYIYRARSALVHGETDKIPPMRQNERESLAALGMVLEDEYIFHKYHVADFARKVARRTLLLFLDEPARLGPDWLLRLELGLV